MIEKTDQRICTKFCFNLGKSCTETIEMIQKAFVDESMGITQIKEWYRRLKSTSKSEPCQVNADYFFRLWSVVHYEFAPRGETINKDITLKFWKDCVMPWEDNDRVSGQAVTGFFTTITRQRIHRTLCSYFWRNTRLYSFASLHTVQK